jgi:hypothetical protein
MSSRSPSTLVVAAFLTLVLLALSFLTLVLLVAALGLLTLTLTLSLVLTLTFLTLVVLVLAVFHDRSPGGNAGKPGGCCVMRANNHRRGYAIVSRAP